MKHGVFEEVWDLCRLCRDAAINGACLYVQDRRRRVQGLEYVYTKGCRARFQVLIHVEA